jgi:hypothetical protein
MAITAGNIQGVKRSDPAVNVGAAVQHQPRRVDVALIGVQRAAVSRLT